MENNVSIIQTEREGMYNITDKVQELVEKSGMEEGVCVVYCPHTTAGITINECADPDVVHDLMLTFHELIPDRKNYRHFEGNSAAHMKALLTGSSQAIPVRRGQLDLGRWQGIFFCEFDGPRVREYHVSFAAEVSVPVAAQ